MSQKTKNILFQVFPVIILVILSLVAIIFAWTEPTQAPPGGNVPAPLNVGTTTQTKLGALSVPTLFDTNNPAYFIDPSGPISAIFSGNVVIGTTTPPLEKLDVAGAIKISDTPSPCDASRRGTIKFISGTSGTADCLAVCKRRADGTFAWTCIDVGVGVGIGGLQFKYRRPITISNPGSSLTDYQISITLDTASLIAANKIRPDCGDIRVTDSDGSTFLPYSLGIGECNSAVTKIWSKVSSLPTGTKTIYVYYGLPLLPAETRLWYNVKHLNLLEGVFNYHAALGVGGFHSRKMQHRLGVAAGSGHTCALLTNGNIDCWGRNDYGQAADYLGGNAIGIAAGTYHTCALLTNGNVDCWGANRYGEGADYFGGNATGVAAGYYHTCALLTNGNIDCWGYAPVATDYTGGNAIAVAVGEYHTCALLTNGNIDCWGEEAISDYTGGNAIGIAAGNDYTCALLTNGNVDCWGRCGGASHNYGQCADYFGRNAIGVAAGGLHTCALLTNGNVVCWGNNAHGQAAHYLKGNAIGVASGVYGAYTCAVLTNGNVDCWGLDFFGETNGKLAGTPTRVAAGMQHTCALLTNGNIDCWGCGDGSGRNFGQCTDYLGGNARGVAAGSGHTCALLTNGNVDCWGLNTSGQAADYLGGNATSVAAGGAHTCALLTNGNIDCWGLNDYGQAADYLGGNARGVAAGSYHTCALLTNGNIDCWGRNDYGQAADYTKGNAIGVAAGAYHTCALLTNGNIDCWGLDPFGWVLVAQDYIAGESRNPFRKYALPAPTTSVGAEESLY